MPVQDILSLEDDVELAADVCLVGSGPASWTLARRLAESELRVLVLESGRGRPEEGSAALNETEDVGMPLFNGRCRRFGGTTESTGWGNRCIPFDAIDYEQRPWIDGSGWPFGPEEIAPYLDAASEFLGAGPHLSEPPTALPAPRGVSPPAINPMLLRNVYWVFGRDRYWSAIKFSNLFRERGDDRLRVVLGATVVDLDMDTQAGRISRVGIADPVGRRRWVSARTVVLCAGGIENARLLLNARQQAVRGLGNEHDLVGRFLMDHPRDTAMTVTFDPREAKSLNNLFGPFRFDSGDGARLFTGGFALSEAVQRAEGLLNCAAWPMEETAPDDPIEAVNRLARRDRSQITTDLYRIAAKPGFVLRGAHSQLRLKQPVRRMPSRIGFYIASEQTPNPASRVTLSDRCDRFGLPLARTDWRISHQDRASQGRLAKLITSEFGRLRLPTARLADWVRDEAYDSAVLQDGCHPTGVTRMAADPRKGVVDANCQVHGIDGLYVAGSSVFPTAGHANPTLMIVAMACRLADHLKRELQATHALQAGPPVLTAPDDSPGWAPVLSPGTRVAVTGANGFIGGRLVERLIEQGVKVTCLNRGPLGSRLKALGVDFEMLDLADVKQTAEALKGSEIVFHCAYDWQDEAWNMRALHSLIASTRANGCMRFVHISSFVVYEIPRAGDVTEATEETSAGSGYAFAKRQMEVQLLAAYREDGFPCAILQPTIVYGQRSKPWALEPVEMLRYGTLILPDAGEGLCAAVHVDDVVDAMFVAARNPAAVGKRFLISGPQPVTWRDFYETLAANAGVKGPTYLPMEVIERENTKLAKLRRLLTTPERLIRKVAQIRPLAKIVRLGLKGLPVKPTQALTDRLYGPNSRRRGYVHMPSVAHARWISSQSVIMSNRARREIGYRPRVELVDGMATLMSGEVRR